MSIFGAMFSGVSGLNVNSTALGAISDNITNANTTGYKATEVSFSTLVTQQVSKTQYTPGGAITKPRALIDVQGLLQANTSPTALAISGQGFFVVNKALDPTDSTQAEFVFTRAGDFKPDETGFLKNTAGFFLMAWPLDVAGDIQSGVNTSIVDDLVPVNLLTIGGNATPTTDVELGINLPATDETGDTEATNVRVFDSLGVPHDLTLTWTKQADSGTSGVTFNDDIDTDVADLAVGGTVALSTFTLVDGSGTSHTVTVTLVKASEAGAADTFTVQSVSFAGGTATLNADSTNLITFAASATTDTIKYDFSFTSSGADDQTVTLDFSGLALAAATALNAATVTNDKFGTWQLAIAGDDATLLSGGTQTVRFNPDGSLNYPPTFDAEIDWTAPNSDDSTLTFDLGTSGDTDGLTQFASDYTPTFINQNGATFGFFSGVTVSDTGTLSALFDNGETRPVYQVPLATFPNPNGLVAQTGNAYEQSDFSGQYFLREAGAGGSGRLAAAALETSTVDLAEEFTRMIIVQRAYSANARTITTADEMLEELIRLKR